MKYILLISYVLLTSYLLTNQSQRGYDEFALQLWGAYQIKIGDSKKAVIEKAGLPNDWDCYTEAGYQSCDAIYNFASVTIIFGFDNSNNVTSIYY